MSNLADLTTIHKRIGSINTKISVLEDRREGQVELLKEHNVTTKAGAKDLRRKLSKELSVSKKGRDLLQDEILSYLKKVESDSDEY